MRQGALIDQGKQGSSLEKKSNVARNAYRMIRRTGLGWRIPIETFDHQKLDGTFETIHYLRPQKILEYFIAKKPILVCGEPEACGMGKICKAFWESYRGYHPTHQVFQSHAGHLHRVIPLAIHGDEGKGKRRSNTTLVALEAVIGCKGETRACTECKPSWVNLANLGPRACDEHFISKTMRTNMKGHSYLQHWPLFIVPGILNKNYKPLTLKLLEVVATDLEQLFTTGIQVGGETYFGAIIAAKGDLKWHTKVGRLVRSFEHQGRKRDLQMCHWCGPGSPGNPAEDVASDHPCWERTLFFESPWLSTDLPPMNVIPFDAHCLEMMYQHDPFHTLRLGLYRDFVGSAVFLYMSWGLFGAGRIPVKLEAAWSSFYLWQMAERKRASLRSFSTCLFNYKSKKSYPWINAKGSDVTLCLKWLCAVTYGFIQTCIDAEQVRILNVILSTSRTAIDFFDHMNEHRLWMSTACAAYLYEVGHAFLVGYTWLAGFAYQSQLCLFSVKPKAHFHRHILLSLLLQIERHEQVVLNPLVFNCEQNEDMIGKISSLTIKLDSRVSTRRVLEFWMVKAAILFKRHFGGK